MILRICVLISIILGLSACSPGTKKSDTKNNHLAKLASNEMRRQQAREMRRINQIIKKEKKLYVKRKAVELNLPKNVSEENLYSEVVVSFQGRQLDRLLALTDELIKRFPNSPYCDNALVLSGQLNMAMGMDAEGLRYFERVLQEYPMGNKRASALFGKGVAYRKLRLFKYSLQAFETIRKEFPGSPEASRVDFEERLLKVEESG